jgi:hypothetical protein
MFTSSQGVDTSVVVGLGRDVVVVATVVPKDKKDIRNKQKNAHKRKSKQKRNFLTTQNSTRNEHVTRLYVIKHCLFENDI